MATKVAVTIATLTAPFVVVLGVALAVTVVLPGVTLMVEWPTYAVGETVRFQTCSAPWQVLRELNGGWQPVEQHACLYTIVEVRSGSTMSWSWVAKTQAAGSGLAPVGPGQYRIDIAVLSGCDPAQGGCQPLHLTGLFRLV